MRYIYVILTVLIFSSVCNAGSSPNVPPAVTLLASPNTPAVAQPSPPPTIIQPTISHSDEAIRAERDAYKEVVKAHQETLTTIKWAIGIILAMFGYVIFRSTREYKEAVIDAKKACEKAEEWEEKARTAFEKIDIRVENKLEQMEKAIGQKSQAVLDSIDKKAEAKLKNIGEKTQKSTQEIDAKAKKQMRITELQSNAFRLQNEGKYEEACEKYAEIVGLRPKDSWAYNNWGIALADRAKLKGNEELFKEACSKYAKTIEIEPDDHEAYNNWGFALADWAKLKGNEELFKEACGKYAKATEIKYDYHEAYYNWGFALADWAEIKGSEELFKEACGKYAKVIEIKPNDHDAYGNWGLALSELAKLKVGTPEHEDLLRQAEEKGLKAESLKKGEGAYNLACIYALRENKPECKKWLLAGQEAGTLPERDHAMKDSDLESVKNEQWFKEIKWKGEK